MSWPLSKPNVTLRVTKFAPEAAPAPAGLSAETREAHRAKRAAECAPISPAIEYPDWRREELARKYDDNSHKERYERGFYDPYG